MPLGPKLGGEINERKISKGEKTDKGYLTTKQANYIYRKIESGNLTNKNMMRQETDQDIELDSYPTGKRSFVCRSSLWGVMLTCRSTTVDQ